MRQRSIAAFNFWMGDLKFLQILVSNVKITFEFKEEMFEEKYFMYDVYTIRLGEQDPYY